MFSFYGTIVLFQLARRLLLIFHSRNIKSVGNSPIYRQGYEEKRRHRNGVPSFGGVMKLKLIFVLMELAILVIYPFAFLAGKLRQILKFRG
jgi:hypothetical protein